VLLLGLKAMANAPSPPWTLSCPWCGWRIAVSARGMRGNDPGSGVAAANLGREHAEDAHDKTWHDFLAALGVVGEEEKRQ
jgi:hypothetical protein